MTEASLNILIALADGEKHGYAIMREINDRKQEGLLLYPGTLYANIKRLLGDRFIEEAGERRPPGEDERRRFYRLTDRGRTAALAELVRLETLVRTASVAFKGSI